MVWYGLAGRLLKLDLPVGLTLWRTECPGGLGRPGRGVVLGRGAIGLLDGAQPGGDAGLAGGDGLAVLPAVGVLGQVLADLLDFADVGFALVGVGGDREQGDVGGGGVQDQADGLVWLDSAPYSSSISLSGACSGTRHALVGSGGMYMLSRSMAVR